VSRFELVAVALICAQVALIPVVFDLSADIAFTVPKALFTHAASYLLAAAMIATLIYSPRLLRLWSPLNLAVLTYLLVNVAATIFAEDRRLALFGAHDRMLGLGTLSANVVLYFGVAYLIRTRARAVALALSFMSGVLIVLGYELLQAIGRDPIQWAIDSAVRPFSTVGQSNSLAEYLMIAGAVAAAVAIFDAHLRGWQRAAWSVVAGAAVLGAIATQTRSVLLGLAGAEAAFLSLIWIAHRGRRSRLIGTLGALGCALAFLLLVVASPIGNRVASTVQTTSTDPAADPDAGPKLEAAADVRVALYRIAVQSVGDHPALGAGPDNFINIVPRYRSANEPFEVQANPNSSAHSWVAQVANSSGVAGLATFISIPALAVWLALRRRLQTVDLTKMAVGVVALSVFLGEGLTTINEISTEWSFWVGAGLVASATLAPTAAAAAPATTTRSRASRASRGPAWTGVVAVVIGAGLALTVLGALEASRAARASAVARTQGRAQQAVAEGVRATTMDSGRADYFSALGLAYIAADRVRDAVVAFERASQLAPYDVRHDGNLARALAVLGQRGDDAARRRSIEIADRAVSIDPNNPQAHLTRATVLQASDDAANAVPSIERAVALDRVHPSGQTALRQIYITGIQVLSAARRPDDAYTLARLALARLPIASTQVPVRVEYARAFAADGKFTQALAEIDAALAIEPGNTAAQQLRAQIASRLP
jgi:tetratricopeptide (TPR) repeat protein